MILYQLPRNRSWKSLRSKALRLLIFNTSAVERKRFERKRFDPIPRPFPIQGKGAALEDISPVAPWEVAQPGQPVKGAEHRRVAAALPLTGCPGCAMGGAATGDTSSRASMNGAGKTGGGASGHGVQNTQKHRFVFIESGVLRKIDSPLNCCVFVCSC